MTTQIFKSKVPKDFFYDFLEKICDKENLCYIFNINSYKKILFYNYHIDFLNELKKYYHVSKQFYIEREFTYNSIATILRQICKSHILKITSKMKYFDSVYIIEYSIPIYLD